jgi:hypothetical protein
VCRDDGFGTLALDAACGAGAFCAVGTRACVAPACHTDVCAPGAAATCDEQSAGMCLTDGSGLAAGATDCSATGQVCVSGACAAPLFEEEFEEGVLTGWTGGSADTNVHAGLGHLGTGGLEMQMNADAVKRTFANLQPHEISLWMRGQAEFVVNQSTVASIAADVYVFASNGIIQNTNSVVTADLNQWHFVELRNIDWAQRTYDYYLDKQLLLAAAHFQGNGTSVTALSLIDDGVVTNQEPAAFWDDIVMK